MGDFKRLIAWQNAHAYVISVHAAFNEVARLCFSLTRQPPSQE
jgi:hypothetical protein